MRRFIATAAAILGIAWPAFGDGEMLITSPADGASVVKNVGFPLVGIQQVRPDDPGQAIALQFAPTPDGPWQLCTRIGEGGPIEVNAWCYTAQGSEFELEIVIVHQGGYWVRAAVYLDQGATGVPIRVSPPVRWIMRASHVAPPPR